MASYNLLSLIEIYEFLHRLLQKLFMQVSLLGFCLIRKSLFCVSFILHLSRRIFATGRGIDRIFEGSLVYGNPLPDYSNSTAVTVSLFIPRSKPDPQIAKLVSNEQNRLGDL